MVGERPLDLSARRVGEQPVDHPAHVGLVIDGVALGAPERAGVLAQQPRAHRVKRGRGDAARDRLAEQVGQAQPQLAGGAHAEGDREDLPRLRAPARQQVRDAVRERSGLAGAGTGQQEQRAGAVGDGTGLLGGQPREQAVGPGRRVAARARVRERHQSPPVKGSMCDASATQRSRRARARARG